MSCSACKENAKTFAENSDHVMIYADSLKRIESCYPGTAEDSDRLWNMNESVVLENQGVKRKVLLSSSTMPVAMLELQRTLGNTLQLFWQILHPGS